jgi:hypothetical protein
LGREEEEKRELLAWIGKPKLPQDENIYTSPVADAGSLVIAALSLIPVRSISSLITTPYSHMAKKGAKRCRYAHQQISH